MNLKNGVAGFAIQSAKGAAEAQPQYAGPVGGGKLLVIEVEQVEDELTSSQIGSPGEYRESAAFAGEWEGRMWPASFAGLLYAVMGAVQTTGAVSPFSHAITAAAELPWCTVFGEKGSGASAERKAFPDCKCDALKIEWEGNGPVKVTPTWGGLDVDWSDAAFDPDLDEEALAYLKGIHAAVVLDLDGGAHDGGAEVKGGSIEIKRNTVGDTKSGQLEPTDISEGNFECDVEFSVRVPDLAAIRLLLTGAEDGTSVAVDVPYGDFTVTFADSPASVALAATHVAWKVPEEPDADPKGGPAEIKLQGRCYGSSPLSGTVVNSVATY
jgi:hypothetical protein